MRKGRTILLMMTIVFLLTEIFFNYMVLTKGDGDIIGATSKTLFFLLFILLFSRKLTLAKWLLSISLIIYGLLCLIAGFELTKTLCFIGIFDIFFGFYIHKSKALQIFRDNTISNQDFEDAEAIIVNHEHQYPRLVRRYKALLIDGLLIMFSLITIMIIIEDIDSRTPIMVSSVFIILLTYEPFLTSYSKTIGQRIMKIKIVKYGNPEERISLVNAYLRWFTKGMLGWISFITIHSNPQRRAIHDFASDSIMINEE